MTTIGPPRAVSAGDPLQFSLGEGNWTILLAAREPGTTSDSLIRSVATPETVVGRSGTVLEVPTTNWAPGTWLWRAERVLNNVTATAGSGEVKLWPGLTAAAVASGQFVETRTPNELALIKLRETLRRWNDQGWVQQQAIQGRSLSRYTLAELRDMEQLYALRVRHERQRRGLRVKPRYVTMRPR